MYDGLKFIKMIKETDGADPSNFIVTKKDQHILESSKLKIERYLSTVATDVKYITSEPVKYCDYEEDARAYRFDSLESAGNGS